MTVYSIAGSPEDIEDYAHGLAITSPLSAIVMAVLWEIVYRGGKNILWR
jgi:hypothetical protein